MASPPLTIERAYRQRCSPSREQARKLSRLMGARRFVTNWALARQEAHYAEHRAHLSWVALSREFTDLKRKPETAWLAELPREPFNQTLRDLNTAWQRYFKKLARKPRRKKYGTVKSLRFTLDQRRSQVDREGGTVQLDGVGRVRFKVTRPLEGRPRSVTVSVDPAGRWFVCFTADGIPTPEPEIARYRSVGIDRGVKTVAVTSRAERFPVVRELERVRAARRRHQRSYSRGLEARLRAMGLDPRQPIPKGTRIEPSRRMRQRQQRIGRLTARLSDLRREALHQASRALVNGSQVICLEDLSVRGLARGGHRALRRSVHEASMGELARLLGYKASWAGREVVKIDRFFPSSQLCSTPGCDYRHTGLRLKERRWCCPQCGVTHDRDVNAARNIEREGLRLLAESAPGSGVRDVRGGYACAAGGDPPVGQPSLKKRELTPHAALRRGHSTVSVGPGAVG